MGAANPKDTAQLNEQAATDALAVERIELLYMTLAEGLHDAVAEDLNAAGVREADGLAFEISRLVGLITVESAELRQRFIKLRDAVDAAQRAKKKAEDVRREAAGRGGFVVN